MFKLSLKWWSILYLFLEGIRIQRLHRSSKNTVSNLFDIGSAHFVALSAFLLTLPIKALKKTFKPAELLTKKFDADDKKFL